MTRGRAVAVAALVIGLSTLGAGPSPSDDLAAHVTIYRDSYGIPHVVGETDASTLFGFAYAQAEDNFWRIEDNYIKSLGRQAEVEGEDGLVGDRRTRALELPRLAKAEYSRMPKQDRKSTRLNSSHLGISYAVFCLKKKK